MDNLKVLIVEDEVLIAEDLKDNLISFGIENISMAHDKEDALIKLKQNAPDLVLLDIRMKGANDGIEIANIIKQNYHIPYVFITSHSDIETIKEIVKSEPAGYITKPFKRSDLFANLSITLSLVEREVQVLRIKDGYDIHMLNQKDITFIRSDGNYIDIFYNSDQRITCRKTLESIVLELNPKVFIKINKSHIVNLKKVKSFNSRELMINDLTITISRNIYSEFLTRINSL